MTDGSSASCDDDGAGHEESTGTVLLALSANLGIGVAKLIGGLLSGSAAMLAEAAHSAADTLNQVLLLAGLRRSRRPADDNHPFGYGQERYFWSLLAAVGIFVLGAGYSVYEGVDAIRHPEPLHGVLVPYVVLALGSGWRAHPGSRPCTSCTARRHGNVARCAPSCSCPPTPPSRRSPSRTPPH